jgi:hypothetical protein
MGRVLVGQAETDKPSATGRWYGYEIYDVEGGYTLVIHTSMYDGIKRTDHYACPEQPLDALTRAGALDEAAHKTAAYARALGEVLG